MTKKEAPASFVVFITGGVLSSLGKGIVASSLGALLRARGFSVRLRKFDPYINVDSGTMSPYQHGEVFVTEDGTEVDLDLGSYERFTDVNAESLDSTTAGKVYSSVIEKERQGTYLGQTIQVIPHITNEIKERVLQGIEKVDFMICEIGGTVGDIESLPFLEAIRQIRDEKGRDKSLFIHVGWVPFFQPVGEYKTKPLQHSVKELQRCGIQPDLLVCRCDHSLPLDVKEKISLLCSVALPSIIEAQDLSTIYQAPLAYHEAGLDHEVCKHFSLLSSPQLHHWQKVSQSFSHLDQSIHIAIVGKHTRASDAYRSLLEALFHGGLPHHIRVHPHLIDAEELEEQTLETMHGLIIPGGFGIRGTEGMMKAIAYARRKNLPFLGICFGMQLAIIEAIRSLHGFEEASSSEFGPTPHPVIALLKEWSNEEELFLFSEKMGGTMRLGSYPCYLQPESRMAKIYGKEVIFERHRHRYEVNKNYKQTMEEAGCFVAGFNGTLVECIERRDHSWFMATQFHPEFISRPFSPHPLFISFTKASLAFRDHLLKEFSYENNFHWTDFS